MKTIRDKYRGMTFAQAAKKIDDKYKDRQFDSLQDKAHQEEMKLLMKLQEEANAVEASQEAIIQGTEQQQQPMMKEGGQFPDRYKKMGFSGVNKPKRTPGASKSHAVVVKDGGNYKLIRFGQQGVSGAGKNPKSDKEKARRKSFKARHAKNIAKGKTSAAYWANKVKWAEGGWIKEATDKMKEKGTEGAFTRSANAAGMGVQEYANKVLSDPNASTTQKKRANFAKNMKKINKKKMADGGIWDTLKKLNEADNELLYGIGSAIKGFFTPNKQTQNTQIPKTNTLQNPPYIGQPVIPPSNNNNVSFVDQTKTYPYINTNNTSADILGPRQNTVSTQNQYGETVYSPAKAASSYVGKKQQQVPRLQSADSVFRTLGPRSWGTSYKDPNYPNAVFTASVTPNAANQGTTSGTGNQGNGNQGTGKTKKPSSNQKPTTTTSTTPSTTTSTTQTKRDKIEIPFVQSLSDKNLNQQKALQDQQYKDFAENVKGDIEKRSKYLSAQQDKKEPNAYLPAFIGQGLNNLINAGILASGPDRRSPIFNPYESEVRRKMDAMGVDIDPIRQSIQSNANAAVNRLSNMSRSAANYKSNIQNLYANMNTSLANADMQQQQQLNNIRNMQASTINNLGVNKQQALSLAAEINDRNKAAFQSALSQTGAELARQSEFLTKSKINKQSNLVTAKIYSDMFRNFGVNEDLVAKISQGKMVDLSKEDLVKLKQTLPSDKYQEFESWYKETTGKQ